MRSINRRSFLHQAVGAVAAGAAAKSTALSYGRIIGANDRIALAHVGSGNRGRSLEYILSLVERQDERGGDGSLRHLEGASRASGSDRRESLRPRPPDVCGSGRKWWPSKTLTP